MLRLPATRDVVVADMAGGRDQCGDQGVAEFFDVRTFFNLDMCRLLLFLAASIIVHRF